jgi:hypothetical protein
MAPDKIQPLHSLDQEVPAMFSLVVLTALAQPAPTAPGADHPSGMPPEQMLASIDAKGKVTFTFVAAHEQGPSDHIVTAYQTKGTEKVPVQVKVKLKHLSVTTAELPAEHVEAFTVGGRPLSREQLATLLAKERTVLVAMDGKKVDPFFLRLYKEDAIVLVPPANTLAGACGSYGGYGGAVYAPAPVEVAPVPVAPSPPPKDDGRKPDRSR